MSWLLTNISILYIEYINIILSKTVVGSLLRIKKANHLIQNLKRLSIGNSVGFILILNYFD